MPEPPIEPQSRGARARRWTAVGAASALGFGLVAASAATIAGAMPLVNSTTESTVPPITNVMIDEVKGVSVAGVNATTSPTPTPAPAPSPSSAPDVVQAPAPQPVTPAPAGSLASVVSAASVASPASVESVD